MSLVFPYEKIHTRPNLYKNRNIKREAVWIQNKFVCTLCFKSNYSVVESVVEKDSFNPIRHTARCHECGILIQYNRPVPKVNI